MFGKRLEGPSSARAARPNSLPEDQAEKKAAVPSATPASSTYTCDAWNRLLKVTAASDTDVTLQTAEHDGKGRRMEESGDEFG